MTLPLVVIGGNLDDWGLIISFLDTDDPRSAIEQLDAHYGWRKFDGFTWDPEKRQLTYGDETGSDPPLEPLSALMFRDERILLFPHAWVMVMDEDGDWEICRMD